MKKGFRVVLFALLIILSFSLIVGCKSKLEKEEIAYKMICYVAEDYNEESANVTLRSGRLNKEENGNYFATFTVMVNSYTMYFCGTYYTETGKIEYTNMTKAIHSSITGAGPGYLDTESFDIAKVNKKLKGD